MWGVRGRGGASARPGSGRGRLRRVQELRPLTAGSEQSTFVTFAVTFWLSVSAGACQSDNNHTDGCAAASAHCDGSAKDEQPADASDATVAIPTLAVPGRIHLVNRAAVDVYLGLRFVDRCAFDYAVRGPDAAPDASGPPLIIEQPSCPCHPVCDGCSASCAAESCTE